MDTIKNETLNRTRNHINGKTTMLMYRVLWIVGLMMLTISTLMRLSISTQTNVLSAVYAISSSLFLGLFVIKGWFDPIWLLYRQAKKYELVLEGLTEDQLFKLENRAFHLHGTTDAAMLHVIHKRKPSFRDLLQFIPLIVAVFFILAGYVTNIFFAGFGWSIFFIYYVLRLRMADRRFAEMMRQRLG